MLTASQPSVLGSISLNTSSGKSQAPVRSPTSLPQAGHVERLHGERDALLALAIRVFSAQVPDRSKKAIWDIPAPVDWCVEESRDPFDSQNQEISIYVQQLKPQHFISQSLWIRDMLL